jgi:alpha-glucosidase
VSPSPRARRLHGQEGVTSLTELPMDGGGIRSIERLLLRPMAPGKRPTIHVDRPTLEGGRQPGGPFATLEAGLAALSESFREKLLEPSGRQDGARFEWDGSVLRAQIDFPRGTSFYGAGLVAAPLLRTGRAVVFWNSDAWHYSAETPSLYSSMPYVLALLPDGTATGVLVDSPCRGTVWIAHDGLEFAFEGEPYDVVRIEGAGPAEVTAELTRRTAGFALPPLWALGYHQSRWGWDTADEVLAVARELRARKIPCDALWLDIQHMDRHRPFTFDPVRFPDPEGLLAELREQGFHTVAIVDPALPVDRAYGPTAEALAQGHFVLNASGKPVRGRVWPGMCHFPDFTRGETRAWWAGLVERFARRGLDGLWCDMNEPSVFRVPTKTLPENARHAGDDVLPPADHARYHNLYGQLMAQATREGVERAHPERRPFVLSRAGHLGTARHAATWTGDNQATWEDLRLSIPMVLSLGLCGQPLSGPDLGGFDGDPDGELFARWFELGALLPFARGHSHRDACRKEPWAFGPEVEERVRRALQLRLALLPELYTALHSPPPVRPVFFADPSDARLRAIDDAFLLGPNLLVAPIVERGTDRRSVVLPRGGWYAFDGEGEFLEADELGVEAQPGQPPIFARAGCIVSTARDLARAADLAGEALDLKVFLDRDGQATGWLHQDDGQRREATPANWRRLKFRARPEGGGTAVDVLRSSGELSGALPRLRAVVRSPRGGPGKAPVSIAPALTASDEGKPWWGELNSWRGWGE